MRSRHLILLTHCALLLVLILAGLAYQPTFGEASSLINVLCGLLVFIYVWSLWSWKRIARSLLDPYVLFLTAAVLFNGGQAVLQALGLNQSGILGGRFSDDVLLATLYAVVLGLGALHGGALLGATTRGGQPAGHKAAGIRASTVTRDEAACRLVGWMLILISIVPVIVLLREAIPTVLSGGYTALFQPGARSASLESAPRVLAAFLVPGTLYVVAGSKRAPKARILGLTIMLVYVGLQFFLGSRSNAVMPLVAFGWLWHRSVRPLPRGLLLAGGLTLLVVVFPLVKSIRNVSGSERVSLSAWATALTAVGNPAVAAVSEMGGSMVTVAHTLELVPDVRPFDCGQTYIYGALTVLPNLIEKVHPSVARGLAAEWLVRTVSPAAADQGQGLGYSFIAEAYLNFGWPGIVAVPMVIGFALARFVVWAQRSRSVARNAVLASFTAFFLLFARGEFGSLPRALVWYALLPAAVVYAVKNSAAQHQRIAPGDSPPDRRPCSS